MVSKRYIFCDIDRNLQFPSREQAACDTGTHSYWDGLIVPYKPLTILMQMSASFQAIKVLNSIENKKLIENTDWNCPCL